MINVDRLRTLNVGDVIETGWLLEGLAPNEPVCFKLDKLDAERELYTFGVFYFDIPLGVWIAKIQDGKIDKKTGVVEEKVVWMQNSKNGGKTK